VYIYGVFASSKRSAAPAATSFVAITSEQSASPNTVSVYPFSASGFGTKYTNPTLVLGEEYRSVTFNNTKNVIAFAINSSFSYGGKSIQAYPWSASGFGTAFADPATVPPGPTTDPTAAYGASIAFNSSDDVLALGTQFGGTGERYAFYTWSNSTGFGTKYGNASTTLQGIATNAIKFVPANNRVFLSTNGGGRIASYAWTNASGFGTKSTNPSLTGTSFGVDYNASFATPYVVGSRTLTPFITVYPFASTSFGTAWSNPGTLPINSGRTVKVNSSGNTIIMGSLGGGPIAYATTGSAFGSKYADPVSMPSGSSSGVSFDSTESNVAFSTSGSPYVVVYPWSAGFGTKYADPVSLPGGPGATWGSVAFI
jgi:hypothetical protein